MKSMIPTGKSGVWSVERFEVPQFSVESMRLAMSGRPIRPGTYTRLSRGRQLVMSDTPAEIRDLAPFRWELERTRAKRVLINGLGLGIATQIALSLPHVAVVDVVELSADVIALVKPFIIDSRLHVHNSDALTIEWAKGTRWDVVWHDIWDNMPNSDDKPTISKLKRKYGRRCGWQGVWCEGQSRY